MNPATRAHSSTRATPRWQFAVASGIFGWVLDAFDFFVIIFLLDTLAAHFRVAKIDVVFSLTITLAMRPLGAILFGSIADRMGRKQPLLLCILFFSAVTVLSGFAPSYIFFLVMRALYGIGMGGYWSLGAAYAMESAPTRWRGVFSGIMQAGYPLGYLLAALAMQFVVPILGWRSMFFIGISITALLVALIALAPESESWRAQRPSFGGMIRALRAHLGIFVYLLTTMTIMSCLSHGTQDLYPDFLRSIPALAAHRLLGMNVLFAIPIFYNICAIAAAPFFGQISEHIGRRRAMMLALCLSLLALPAWAFGMSLGAIVLGSCLMQAGVQGAFGVIPAHLTELSPAPVRSLFPGIVYQFGVLIASPAVSLEYLLRDRFGYPGALASFEGCVILLLLLVFAFGPERRGHDFYLGE